MNLLPIIPVEDGYPFPRMRHLTDHFLDAANHVVDVAWEPDWKITSKLLY